MPKYAVVLVWIGFILGEITAIQCGETTSNEFEILAEEVATAALTVEPAVELKRLRTTLLNGYDRLHRPTKNQSLNTNVLIYFDVQYVSLEENIEILAVKGKLMMRWTDEYLLWDPSSYSGISSVRFLVKEVWRPEVRFPYNTRSLDIYEEDHTTPVTVYNNGTVKWYPQTVFNVPCSVTYRHYPFDRHNCSILLRPYGYAFKVMLEKMESPSKELKSIQTAQWLLTRFEHENQVNEELPSPFHCVSIQLFLERMPGIYRYICVVPTLIAIVSLLFDNLSVGFWLLPNETSRYLIGCSNIVVLSMLLQYLALTVPAGREVPLLAQYCASCLCMSAIFIIVTVIANLLRESCGVPPTSLLRLAHSTLDPYLCLSTFSNVSSTDLRNVSSEESTRCVTSTHELKRRKDWHSVSVLIDRIIFWCFAFSFGILLAVLAAV